MDTFEQAFMEGFVEGLDKIAKKGSFGKLFGKAKKAGKGYLNLMSGKEAREGYGSWRKARSNRKPIDAQHREKKGLRKMLKGAGKTALTAGATGGVATGGALGLKALLKKKKKD